MFSAFSHYLSYGATDQQTARALLGSYDGLLVPGTIAAFQREGTGGFVLSLSALPNAPAYSIDPRFPLFQQALRNPKKSHQTLAALLNDPTLISPTPPFPQQFNQQRIDVLARAWIDFNHGYSTATLTKFQKYAKRLGKPVRSTSARGPSNILSLYTIAESPEWQAVSDALFRACRSYDPESVAVLAAATPLAFSSLIAGFHQSRAAIWVSGLDELRTNVQDLALYAKTIKDAARQEKQLFALYGGFFHVLLGSVGLVGASHGIGFGESRVWLELPQSGPPPARYYLPQVHRYVSQDLAFQFFSRDPLLASCNCPECQGRTPLALDYHELMMHSVYSRAEEIRSWAPLTTSDAVGRLDDEYRHFLSRLSSISLPYAMQRQADACHTHLASWIAALRLVA